MPQTGSLTTVMLLIGISLVRESEPIRAQRLSCGFHPRIRRLPESFVVLANDSN
jgi:hypothetical protein